MSLLTPHRWNVDEYRRMGETGILPPDARVELLEGEILDMLPIGPFHSSVTARLDYLFNKVSQDRYLVWQQHPISMDDHSEPVPDLTLVRFAEDFYASRLPRPEDVFLIVEVADSSVAYDRTRKLPACARAGIEEFWLVNLPALTLEVHREPHFTGYGNSAILRAGDTVSPLAVPDVEFEVGRVPGVS